MFSSTKNPHHLSTGENTLICFPINASLLAVDTKFQFHTKKKYNQLKSWNMKCVSVCINNFKVHPDRAHTLKLCSLSLALDDLEDLTVTPVLAPVFSFREETISSKFWIETCDSEGIVVAESQDEECCSFSDMVLERFAA